MKIANPQSPKYRMGGIKVIERNKKFDIFISYKSQNVILVRQIAERLKASGINTWFDEYSILLDNSMDTESIIQDAIINSSYGLIFTNDLYFESAGCRNELKQLLRHCDSNHIIHIQLSPSITFHPILTQLSGCPSLNTSNIEEICAFIASTIDKKIVNHYSPAQNNFSKVYTGKYLGIPYQLNIDHWEEETWPFIAKLFGVFSGSKLGPCFSFNIGGYRLEINLCVGPELHPQQVNSQVMHAIDHREIQKKLLCPLAKTYFRDFGPDSVVGVHLLPHYEFMHHAFTYRSIGEIGRASCRERV